MTVSFFKKFHLPILKSFNSCSSYEKWRVSAAIVHPSLEFWLDGKTVVNEYVSSPTSWFCLYQDNHILHSSQQVLCLLEHPTTTVSIHLASSWEPSILLTTVRTEFVEPRMLRYSSFKRPKRSTTRKNTWHSVLTVNVLSLRSWCWCVPLLDIILETNVMLMFPIWKKSHCLLQNFVSNTNHILHLPPGEWSSVLRLRSSGMGRHALVDPWKRSRWSFFTINYTTNSTDSLISTTS